MRIFIAHKFQKVNKKRLKENIEKIALVLERRGFQTFNYFRDRENWRPQKFPPGKVIKEAFEELKKCNALLVFIDSPRKSEGIFLEIGFAKALDKRIILLKRSNCLSPTLEAIADYVIEFKNEREMENKLGKLRVNFEKLDSKEKGEIGREIKWGKGKGD